MCDLRVVRQRQGIRNVIDDLYPDGVDVVWLACDCEGGVGAFVSGGVAPIPDGALVSTDILLGDIEILVNELAETSASHLLEPIPLPNSFDDLAKRGIYVYDWADVGRSQPNDLTNAYELIALPIRPLSLTELPEALAVYVEKFRLSTVRFSDTRMIDFRSFFDCHEGIWSRARYEE